MTLIPYKFHLIFALKGVLSYPVQKMCPILTFSCTCMMAIFAQLVTRIRNDGFSAQLNVPSTQSRVRSPSCSIEGRVAQNPCSGV